MNPKDESIITEDGQRLSIQAGEITGTEDTGPGLAHQTGNTQDEPNIVTGQPGQSNSDES